MNEIKNLRITAGLTQQATADAIGIHIRQVQKIEAGEFKIENVTFRTGLGLAKALGVDPWELLATSNEAKMD